MIKKTYNKQQKGFTLIELSIAIIVIGVLVGGIVLGGKIIEQSKFTKFLSEFQSVVRATTLFKNRYNTYPGDYNGYGSSVNCPESRTDTTNSYSTSHLIVCPGNKNEQITTTTSENLNNESGYGMNHLVHEELLSSNFSTRDYLLSTGTLSADGVIEGVFPKSYGNDIKWNYGNGFKDANPNEVVITLNNFKSTDLNVGLASKIDVKLDDAIGSSGKIRINSCNNQNEYSAVDDADADKECSIAFLLN